MGLDFKTSIYRYGVYVTLIPEANSWYYIEYVDPVVWPFIKFKKDFYQFENGIAMEEKIKYDICLI